MTDGNGQHDEPRRDKNGTPLSPEFVEQMFKPGSNGNPETGEKHLTTYARLVRKLKGRKAHEFPWASKVAATLGLTDFDLTMMTIGDLVAQASVFQACMGKGGTHLKEVNDRCDGKVADKLDVSGTVQQEIVIHMFPEQPPPGHYEDMRKLIGHRPGDPMLPGETQEEA